MSQIELSCGTMDYTDTGGAGAVLVFLHGLLMDASLWDAVIADLSADHRCVAPTLPLGAHRHPMQPDTDLSLPGIARLVAEFCDRLDLDGVTLVGNDTGGALVQLLVADGTWPALSRVVLASCDAFDNFPPGLTGKTLVASGRLSSGMFGLFMQQMRLRPVRRLPIAFGWLTKRGDAATAEWMKPVLTQAAIRRDTVRVLRVPDGQGPAGRRGRTAAGIQAPGPGRLGQRGPGDATRARAAPGRAPAGSQAGRGGGQLHAHPAGPAGPVR